MFWLSRRNNSSDRNNSDEYLERLKIDFASQAQSLQHIFQQNIQLLQQNLAEEIRQLKHTEEIREQNLTEEMRQLKQQRVSYWSTAQSTIEQMQRQVGELSRKVSRLVPDSIPPNEKNLGELQALDIDKAQIAINAVEDYRSAHPKIEQTFDTAKQKRHNAQENLRTSFEKLFPYAEQDTDSLQALNPEDEENPPETA